MKLSKKKFDKLLHTPMFLSLFYQARKRAEENNIPLAGAWMEIGMNKYKEYFFKLNEDWGITNLTQVVEFDIMVRKL